MISEEKAESKDFSADDGGGFERDKADHEKEMKRKGGMFLFPYPVVTIILYFVFLFTDTGWGFSWLIFFTIPIYYGIAEMVYQRKRKSITKASKENNDLNDR